MNKDLYFLFFWFKARFGEIFLKMINSHFFYIFIRMIVTLATNKNSKENKLAPWSRYGTNGGAGSPTAVIICKETSDIIYIIHGAEQLTWSRINVMYAANDPVPPN